MKDETAGKPIKEFVGLRSKMYSLLVDGKEKKRQKASRKVSFVETSAMLPTATCY